MNKFKSFIVLLLGIIVLGACGNSKSKDAGKLESVTYELKSVPGTISEITFEYDKDNNIQKSVTQSDVTFAQSGGTKEDYQKVIEASKAMYDLLDGVKHTTNFTDDTLSETLEITVKDVPEESLMVLFPTAKDGKVSLDAYAKNLEAAGFTKK